MENKTRKKSNTSLAQKLRKAIGNIHVDVFGHEKNVTRNIHTYFERISRETTIPKDRIIIRIFRGYQQIRVCVYKEGKLVKEIDVSELVMIFTNTDPSGLPQLQQKAIIGIERFMTEYCTTHLIHPDNLHICILTAGEKIIVRGINRTKEIGTIPLMALIKHFTR